MNQAQLIEAVEKEAAGYGKTVSKTDIRLVILALADVVQAELHIDGGEVTLPGIGKLKAEDRPAKTGRNPKTGLPLLILAKRVPKFTAAKALKDAVL